MQVTPAERKEKQARIQVAYPDGDGNLKWVAARIINYYPRDEQYRIKYDHSNSTLPSSVKKSLLPGNYSLKKPERETAATVWRMYTDTESDDSENESSEGDSSSSSDSEGENYTEVVPLVTPPLDLGQL